MMLSKVLKKQTGVYAREFGGQFLLPKLPFQSDKGRTKNSIEVQKALFIVQFE